MLTNTPKLRISAPEIVKKSGGYGGLVFLGFIVIGGIVIYANRAKIKEFMSLDLPTKDKETDIT